MTAEVDEMKEYQSKLIEWDGKQKKLSWFIKELGLEAEYKLKKEAEKSAFLLKAIEKY